ncbi:carbohydrate ABC transporter permease [Conexibacter sp. JD483]|uniref:carbohydrate ABC transporter permease n=1 Tax=unclassified Conexibacter TaxID=2627773 RepID=UPI00271CB064|nr:MULTISPECIES: carbohydrate ABC transporter permease [unclassified Conexibacter]MDO8189268.1 carbohydrate ABC transporter permease [Conexibacter sp. CPCC 205706]MDO8201275.1 carbohydrate ABC transporter permease [Conexibacter sp. CPCC 205762]MDR9372170.1 carbohydrate ABC transporter permease [Conexibacter sp. JD483]
MSSANASLARRVVGYAALIALAVVAAAPLLWMLSTSLKSNSNVFSYPPQWIPHDWKFSNYTSLWDDLPMNRWLLNTAFISTAVVLGQLLFCSMAAYAFARMTFRGRDLLFYVFLASLMVPYQVTLIPAFVLISKLGWIDTYKALIIPQLSTPFGIFMLRQFFMTLPKELEEAARLDGASYWRIYRTIIIPLAKPSLLAFGVFSFIGMWGDFLWPLIVTNTPDKMTLTVGLNYLSNSYNTDWARLMAGDVISLAPLMLIYAIAQRYFIQGIAMTGLKG